MKRSLASLSPSLVGGGLTGWGITHIGGGSTAFAHTGLVYAGLVLLFAGLGATVVAKRSYLVPVAAAAGMMGILIAVGVAGLTGSGILAGQRGASAIAVLFGLGGVGLMPYLVKDTMRRFTEAASP